MTEQFRRLARSVFKTKLEVDLRETSPGSSINKKPAKANILQRSSNVTDQKRIDSIKGWLDLLANVLEVPFAVTKMDSSFLVAAISLPALTQETVGQWAAYGKAIIYCMTEQKPENNPVLRKIGRYRKDVYYRKDTTPSTFKERTKAARGTENSNIRDGIFTRIKAAYPKVIKDRGKKLSASKASRSNRAPNKGET